MRTIKLALLAAVISLSRHNVLAESFTIDVGGSHASVTF